MILIDILCHNWFYFARKKKVFQQNIKLFHHETLWHDDEDEGWIYQAGHVKQSQAWQSRRLESTFIGFNLSRENNSYLRKYRGVFP